MCRPWKAIQMFEHGMPLNGQCVSEGINILCAVIPKKAASKDVMMDANSWSGKSGRATKLRRLLASSYTLGCSRLIVATISDESACDKGSTARLSDNLERACRAAGLTKNVRRERFEGNSCHSRIIEHQMT